MAWNEIGVSDINESGTYRFTLDYPGMVEGWLPDLQPGGSTQVFGYLFTLKAYAVIPALKQIIVEIEIVDLANVPASAAPANYLPNPYAPVIRYGGGWVKSGAGMSNAPAEELTPQVVPILGILAGVAALIGVVAIYLSLSKVEKLTESPTVQIAVIAAAAVALFLVVKNLKGA